MQWDQLIPLETVTCRSWICWADTQGVAINVSRKHLLLKICPNETGRNTPSIANFKPQAAWRSIRQWLDAMQLIAAA